MVTYRVAEEKDYAKINDFHNRMYGDSRTLEQFYWEFHRAPAGPSIYIVAEDGDKVVGTQCAIPILLENARGEIILSGKSEDTLVDPAYRGQNVFYRLYEVLFEKCSAHGIKAIWGFTSASKPFKKMGFEIPFGHQQLLMAKKLMPAYRFLASLNKENGFKEKFKIFGLCFISKIKSIFSGKGNIQGYTVSTEKAPGIGHLLKSVMATDTLSTVIQQSPVFQEWRVYNNPHYYKLHEYTFKNDRGEVVASIILNSNAARVAFFIQTLFDGRLDKKTKTAFLQRVTHLLAAEGIVLIRNWTFGHTAVNREEKEAFISAGYFHLDRGIGFVWKTLDGFQMDPQHFILSRIATQGVF